MKYVTRVQAHSITYSFSGPKRSVNLKVDFYHDMISSEKVMDVKELTSLYLRSRDPETKHKFTGPAHSEMSRLVLPDQCIVIQLQRQYFPPRNRHRTTKDEYKPRFPGSYLVGFYYNGHYHSHLLGLIDLDAWMALNQDHLILLTTRREPPKPLPN